jgi:putative tricarboxylic transport membrane protein
MGPQAMPYVIATGMALLAAGNFWLAWRGDFPARESFDPKAIVLILGGLAALIAIIGLGGGFIPATAVLFAATATAFGRRAIHIDLAIGLVLAIVVFLLFDKLLTLSLPAGPLERLL